MLPPYGACLLGSINLARLVRNPFERDAAIDEAELVELTGIAVRMLDNVIDASRYPLAAQKREARAKRRIGLGRHGPCRRPDLLRRTLRRRGGRWR